MVTANILKRLLYRTRVFIVKIGQLKTDINKLIINIKNFLVKKYINDF